jgi:excisionase family DNA binding protein
MSKDIYTYKTAADYLGVSERTVWTLVKTGKIASFPVGRLIRIRHDALLAFILKQEEAVA